MDENTLVLCSENLQPSANEVALATRLDIQLVSKGPELHSRFYLAYGKKNLALHMAGHLAPGPVAADFTSPALSHRVKSALQHQAIARAIGCKPGFRPRVVDGTAGLGKDAFLMASLDCQVVMVERNKVIHALLEDALHRARNASEASVCEAAQRLFLYQQDFNDYQPPAGTTDVVYLDPMFPPRTKSARVKKDMFVLQRFFAAGNDGLSESMLLEKALDMAGKRVVVKRARLDPPLANRAPTYALEGSSSRYDVYICA